MHLKIAIILNIPDVQNSEKGFLDITESVIGYVLPFLVAIYKIMGIGLISGNKKS